MRGIETHWALQQNGDRRRPHLEKAVWRRKKRKCKWSSSVISNQLFATPWTVAYQAPLSVDFPGKSTGMGCQFLLQGIFLTQGSNLGLPHCRQILLPSEPPGKPCKGKFIADKARQLKGLAFRAEELSSLLKDGVLRFMGLQRVGHDWETDLK